LVRWGGALLELAHYKQGHESFDMIQEAIVRLKKALEADPERADAEWCLGNAYTSLGFLCPDKSKAMDQFAKASSCFKRCYEKDSSNVTYQKALEMCEKAPEYYDEIQSHIQAQSMANEMQLKSGGGAGGGAAGAGGVGPGGYSDFFWDVSGWVALAVVISGVFVVSRLAAPKS